jgi:SAM-dependent methyltransferase
MSIRILGAQMDRLMVSMGVAKRPGHVYEVDHDTMDRGDKRITQESFFAAFTDARVISLDVSAYEKAEIICDIQYRLPWRHRRTADFVYDGGSLDNIFDVAAALKNISRLLKPGGRMLATNNGGPHPTAYLKFSADWFMDFFAINQYADCKTYICVYPNSLGRRRRGGTLDFDLSPHETVVYSFNPYVTHEHGEGYDCSSIESQCRYQIYVHAEMGGG